LSSGNVIYKSESDNIVPIVDSLWVNWWSTLASSKR